MPSPPERTQLQLFPHHLDKLRAALEAVDPDELSPKAALQLVYDLRAQLRHTDPNADPEPKD